jgi:type II secretory pathway pseudopilin PulG
MWVVPRWADPRPDKRQSGFTLLELVIVIILVIVLFLTAWWRLLPLRGDAEAAHVASTIGALRSALGLHVAETVVEDSLQAIADLEHGNPVPLLAQPPADYAGEHTEPENAEIPPGSWYFQPLVGELRYRVRYPQYLAGVASPADERPIELSWQVRLSYRENNGKGSESAASDAIEGIRLVALDNPQWIDREESLQLTTEP